MCPANAGLRIIELSFTEDKRGQAIIDLFKADLFVEKSYRKVTSSGDGRA
jgi:hypothetical protein